MSPCLDCGTDYTELHDTDYVCSPDWFLTGREITLHNITVARCACGNAPIFTKLSPLMDLLNQNPATAHVYWRSQSREWSLESL